jgi:DNA-binding MarR family transcriptional regulator
MQDWTAHSTRPLPALLTEVKEAAISKLHERLGDAGHPDIRPGHGCVFRFIDQGSGSRLTEIAEKAQLTKQAVGEVVGDLERMGYVKRVPDPEDGRAKTITLTARGRDAYATAERLFAEIEREWAEELGEDLVAGLREALERIAKLERAPSAARPAAAA